MTPFLTRVLGRLPIGWLQLTHSRGRFFAALAGVSFANLLVFLQLGILGALNASTVAPYDFFEADIIISAQDAHTLADGSNVARVRMFQALGDPDVAEATPLYIGNMSLQLANGDTATLQTFGVNVEDAQFVTASVASQLDLLREENAALIDTATRGISPEVFEQLAGGTSFSFEVNGRTLNAVGTIQAGGGFTADGTMFVSDQTFLRFFGSRSSGAPNHILIHVVEGADVTTVVMRLQALLPEDAVKVQTLAAAAAADLAYQTTERPTGVIFGFGVVIGVIVGIVIVYQVLSTDVANHLREYATFKAMGYGPRFFLGIVFEESTILAVCGFIPGLVVSLGLYLGMSAATGLPVEMNAERIILVFVGTLFACSVSGAIATRRLTSADPADLF
ncbi:ABC transporter permease DevC [Gymnodinialimonas hymeniacidonis]|uniref:ABC transporter permease DevC n=1 Tax=Gymnodinialimonas hymeniacidonis TaxID=3126508 RepID=UPI0034C5CF8E